MNAATEFDVGPLTWVKSEIDLALDRAAAALAQYASAGDATHLKFCRTHLHQVRGALVIVGLDGVTQFAEAIEAFLEEIEAGKVPNDTVLLKDAFDTLRHFLDELLSGEPNQPLRLMPVYERLQHARGKKKVVPTELFYPDLTLPLPRRQASQPLSGDELRRMLRKQRARFQRGLLMWLRDPGNKQGIAEMLAATQRVEVTQELPAARAFWWAASGMLTALAEGSLAAGLDVKQLCARIDLQIRRLQEGSRNVAERLMRDTLYHVALATDSGNGFVRQIKETYKLDEAIPAPTSGQLEGAGQAALLRRLREAISNAEETWGKFCTGSASALNNFRDQTLAVHQLIDQLANTDYRRLSQAISNAAHWLSEQPARHSEALAMEVATAILLAHNALDNFNRLGSDFAHQVDVMVARLHGFLAGSPPAPGSEVPLLDEMSRQAQEKLLIGQVAREIQGNLAQIEQALDSFFRDTGKRGELLTLDAPMHQITGAMMVMGQDAAVATLKSCEADIRRFADENYVPDGADFERVADRLSALGFFIDSMQHGANDFAEFSRAMQEKKPLSKEKPKASSVEHELEQAKRETQALVTALKDKPSDTRLRQELKQNLETLKQDADLIADSALGLQAKVALSALDAGGLAMDEAMATLKPKVAETPTPSAETLQLAQAAEEELDAELLAIFIEEAKEVLAAVSSNLAALRVQPHSVETLTNIRRSFHTLKGSGRMVGLRDLGEVAWEVEQVLNLWLRQEQDVTAALFDLIALGHTVFSDWVKYLDGEEEALQPDASVLVTLAGSLRTGGEPVVSTQTRESLQPISSATPVLPPSLLSPVSADEFSFGDEAVTVVLGTVGENEEAFKEPPELNEPELVIDEPSSTATADADISFEDEATTVVLGSFEQEAAVSEGASDDSELQQLDVSPLDFGSESTDGATGAAASAEAESLTTDQDFATESATVFVGHFGHPAANQDVVTEDIFTEDVATETSGEEKVSLVSPLVSHIPANEEPPLRDASDTVVIGHFGHSRLDQPGETLDIDGPDGDSAPDFDVPFSELEPDGSYAEDDGLVVTSEDTALHALEDSPAEHHAALPSLEEPTATSREPLKAEQDDAPVRIAPSGKAADSEGLTISPTLYGIFLEEVRGHLAVLHREFAILQNDPLQPTAQQMSRAAHTLAGICGTVGLTDPHHLGAALEHALLRRDASESAAGAEGIELLRHGIETLDTMIESVISRQMPLPAPELIVALEAIYPPPAPHDEAADATAASASLSAYDPLIQSDNSDSSGDAGAESKSTSGMPQEQSTFADIQIANVQDELDAQLLPIFLEEAADLTVSINETLRAWRAAPDDAKLVHALHRYLHTLKGSARMAGAMMLGEITHALESQVKETEKTGRVTTALIDQVESAFDGIAQVIDYLQGGAPLDESDVASPEVPVSSVGEAQVSAETLQFAEHEQPAVLESPPIGAIGDLSAISQAEDALTTEGQESHEGHEIAAQHAVLRVRADLIDKLVNEAGELAISRTRIEGEMLALKSSLLDLTENVIRLRRQLRDIEIQAEAQMQSRVTQSEDKHADADFDPLEFDRFTRFQELTRMMAESVNDVATVQQSLLKNLDDANAAILAQSRMNRQLQQDLMSVRMVPFSSQVERLYRIARQTGKELDKRVNLEIRGSQVELDRSVLEKIGVPLEHLLRNAIAHGIENRERRLAVGKSEVGEVSLSLVQEGNEVILTMADDGAGLNFERIRERGIEAGLIASDEKVDEARLVRMIAMPGFSTASEVSRVAGRGVGMDVVKTEIGQLGGRIEISSVTGKGSSFRIYIPLTLAVTQALLVRVGTSLYAIPSSMVEQVLELKEAPLTRIREVGEADWMGHQYPYHFLPHLLGAPEARPEGRRLYWLLLLRSGSQRIALHVDELHGNREIVVKNIGQQIARLVGIDGATVLGDGKVVLILNPVALSSRTSFLHTVTSKAEVGEAHLPPDVEEAEAPARQPTVMVVDDSLTVRKITGRFLARGGYQVLTAKDGVDALEQLLDVVPDVLLVDIEMPRMDGFDLTRNVRADERLKHIPIIMITSRTADKHRSYAFEIGVNHYLGKPYQEDELLALVAGYTHRENIGIPA